MGISKFSRMGRYHEEAGEVNQDYLYSIDREDYLAIMLADGASACKMGLEGAKISCEAMARVIEKEGMRFFRYPRGKIAHLLTEQILYCLECSQRKECELWEYGSTFSMAFMEKETGRTVLVNLGDGAIFTVTENGASCLAKPGRFGAGPCLTTTKGAGKAVDIQELHLALGDSIVIGSDGFLEQLKQGSAADLLNGYHLKDLNRMLETADCMDDCSYISFVRERKEKGDLTGWREKDAVI